MSVIEACRHGAVLGKTPKTLGAQLLAQPQQPVAGLQHLLAALAPVRKHHAQGPRAHTVRGGRALGLGCDDTLTPSSRGPLIRGPSLRLPARSGEQQHRIGRGGRLAAVKGMQGSAHRL